MIPLAFGFCAYIMADTLVFGTIEHHWFKSDTCELVVSAGGDPGANLGFEIQGHDVDIEWLGSDRGTITIDGKTTEISPEL